MTVADSQGVRWLGRVRTVPQRDAWLQAIQESTRCARSTRVLALVVVPCA